MNRLIQLTDANTRLEVHVDPVYIRAMQMLAPDEQPTEVLKIKRPLRTRIDMLIGDRGHTLFVLELPAQIKELATKEEARA